MNATGRPFDDFRALLQIMPEADSAQIAVARMHQSKLAKPQGSLGRLEEIAIWLSGWLGENPIIRHPFVNIFASNNCIPLKDISIFPLEMTKKMVDNITKGGAAINQICTVNDLGLNVYDLALDYATNNIIQTKAMSEESCAATIAYGMETVDKKADLLCIGGMGYGSSVVAATISSVLFGDSVESWLAHEYRYEKKNLDFSETLNAAIRSHKVQNHNNDPFETLCALGGREFAAIIGAILAARMNKIPVILDGIISVAAAAILFKANPQALDHCLVGQASSRSGCTKLLDIIGKKPLLDLDINLEEGVGAALAASVVKSAALTHTQTASLETINKNA